MAFLLSLKQFIRIPVSSVHENGVLLLLNQICFDFFEGEKTTIKKLYKIPLHCLVAALFVH